MTVPTLKITLQYDDFIYDIEVYPNVFLFGIFDVQRSMRKMYEISFRKNDLKALREMLYRLKSNTKRRLVGFNNEHYDYPIVHMLLTINDRLPASAINKLAFLKSKDIINHNDENNRFKHQVPPWQVMIPQVDLVKIHHFDNQARRVSLKVLEFNMRSESIQELPFDPLKELTSEEIDILIEYCFHDIMKTYDFYVISLPLLKFREDLSEKYNRDFTNHNDTRIGKDYFIMRLEEKLGDDICFLRRKGKKKVVQQSKRKNIALKEVIFDYVEFDCPEFNAVKTWIEEQTITKTKGVFIKIPIHKAKCLEQYAKIRELKKKDAKTGKPTRRLDELNCVFNGFKYSFGLGGIHGSIESTTVVSDEEYVIIDLDVISYYTSLGVANNIFPEHLTEVFCDIQVDLKGQRVIFKKGTPENAIFKLALNGVYGESKNEYSSFFDPKYTMSITVNGQLSLCMLAERLAVIENLSMIQINTDGLTVRLPRNKVEQLEEISQAWETLTGLDLESAVYSKMHIRDVNNYIAEYEDSDKIKLKGCYVSEPEWHKNHSALIVPKAAKAALVDGIDIADFIHNHGDLYDFFLRTKIPRSSRLVLTTGEEQNAVVTQIQNVSRFFVADEGGQLTKIMPPLDKTKEQEEQDMEEYGVIQPNGERHIGVCVGQFVQVRNDSTEINRRDINFDYYINETRKIVDPLREQHEQLPKETSTGGPHQASLLG